MQSGLLFGEAVQANLGRIRPAAQTAPVFRINKREPKRLDPAI